MEEEEEEAEEEEEEAEEEEEEEAKDFAAFSCFYFARVSTRLSHRPLQLRLSRIVQFQKQIK